MQATLEAVLEQTRLAPGLDASDLDLARRYATELTRYGVSALPHHLFEGPSGRRLARIACEDIEGLRAMQDRFAERTHDVPPRCLEISEGHGMLSLILGLTLPAHHFHVRDDDHRRLWLWRRMLLSFGVRNVEFLPSHARIAPGEWDLVLVKNCAPSRAMDLAGSLLAAGGDLLLWQDRERANGLRQRHLDARSRPLRLSDAVALQSPPAVGRLVARISSAAAILDAAPAGA